MPRARLVNVCAGKPCSICTLSTEQDGLLYTTHITPPHSTSTVMCLPIFLIMLLLSLSSMMNFKCTVLAFFGGKRDYGTLWKIFITSHIELSRVKDSLRFHVKKIFVIS